MGFRPPLLYLIVIYIRSVKRPARHVRHRRETGSCRESVLLLLSRWHSSARDDLGARGLLGAGHQRRQRCTTYRGSCRFVYEKASNECARTIWGGLYFFPFHRKRFLNVSFGASVPTPYIEQSRHTVTSQPQLPHPLPVAEISPPSLVSSQNLASTGGMIWKVPGRSSLLIGRFRSFLALAQEEEPLCSLTAGAMLGSP